MPATCRSRPPLGLFSWRRFPDTGTGHWPSAAAGALCLVRSPARLKCGPADRTQQRAAGPECCMLTAWRSELGNGWELGTTDRDRRLDLAASETRTARA